MMAKTLHFKRVPQRVYQSHSHALVKEGVLRSIMLKDSLMFKCPKNVGENLLIILLK